VPASRALLRIAVFCLGCLGIAWGAWRFPAAIQSEPVLYLASRVIDGQAIPGEQVEHALTLADQPGAAARCDLDLLRATTVLKLRRAEDALAGGAPDEAFADLAASNGAMLACFGGDGFAHLIAYWLEMNRSGSLASALPQLRASFEAAPNEGWISRKRAWLAFGVFDSLPADLQEKTLADFAGMVNAMMTAEAAAIYEKLSVSQRIRAAAATRTARKDALEALTSALKRRGLAL
jgi:hypothetical protein